MAMRLSPTHPQTGMGQIVQWRVGQHADTLTAHMLQSPSCLRAVRLARPAATAMAAVLLAGCNTIVMNPFGDVARQQAQLIVVSTFLMLLIIVPVIALTLFFAFRYRQSNQDAPYTPDWDHSTRLELAIWGAPLLIIIALGAITWICTL